MMFGLAPALIAAAPYILALGVNGDGKSARDSNQGKPLAPLRYADDDAAAAVELYSSDAAHTRLLTILDEESRREFPDLAARARPPTREELFRAVDELAAAADTERKSGGEPVVVVWIVGHGAFDDQGIARIPLSGGELSGAELDDRVIAPLARVAHRVHLFVDTCFAGALVRSRAVVAGASSAEVSRGFVTTGFERFGNVGVITASSADKEAYEWDEIGGGLFSALARSGLRGAADADVDGIVTYRELRAYFAAAVQAVPIAKARPRIHAVAPPVDVAAPIAWIDPQSSFLPTRGGGTATRLIDDRGRLIAAAKFEAGFLPRIQMPDRIFAIEVFDGVEKKLVRDDNGAWVAQSMGAASGVASRSAVDDALRAGLFATSFGPAYFPGYASADADASDVVANDIQPSAWPLVTMIGGGVMVATAAVFGGVAVEAFLAHQETSIEKPSADAAARFTLGVGVGASALAAAGGLFVASALLAE